MDKSMHSQVYGGISRSPYTPRTQSPSSSIISGRKVHGSGFKKSSTSGRFSVSGRSNQSMQVIARSECNIVESYGLPLPVLVNEALTFSERNALVSINCSTNGWAWAVYGRRLLVWQYKDMKFSSPKLGDISRSVQKRGPVAQCRELTLPHCDIGHKALLISVFMPEGQQMASCLAVSPTGDVRYWPSIAHDSSSVDLTGILEGQEFDYLLKIAPKGYVLATTTCNLVLLQVQLQNGLYNITYRSVKPPSGFFGGIGKKFASIIIGMNSSQDKENRFLKITCVQNEDADWNIFILADRWIQKWLFFANGNEQFLFEDHEILREIREEFQHKYWSGRENNDIEIFLLDMQSHDSKQYVLIGAVNKTHTTEMHYAIVTLREEQDCIKISTFYPLKLSLFYSKETEKECLQIKFILNRGIAYLYGERNIYPVNIINQTTGQLEVEKIEFQSHDDKIMNASICGNIPLFFTRNHGLVCISPADFDPNDFLSSSISPDTYSPSILSESLNQTLISTNVTNFTGNLTIYELNPDEIYNSNKDIVSQLKAAFIYHLKRNNSTCNLILKELLPSEAIAQHTDNLLDKTVIEIAQDLAEDIPASDPRWEHQEVNLKHALGSSSSLQIIQQLKEKNLAMNHFIEFLHATKLWDKLKAVTYRGSLKSTCHILSDINEKIIASVALKCAQNNYTKLIDEAIENVLYERNELPTGSLVHQDLFYVKVTKIEDIFQALLNIINNYIESQFQPSQISAILCETNTVVLAILNDIIIFREKKTELYHLPPNQENCYEYMPWTASSGKYGLRDTLLNLVNVTLKHGARSTGEPELRQKLYQQMTDLIDFLLDGRKKYVDSVKDEEKYGVLLQQYESQRGDLIFPLVQDRQFELAAKLAEKYLDFQTLVLICDETGNQERLDNYIERYKEFEFSQFAITWHLRQNKQGDLFERFKSNQAALSKFLGDHPSLAWIQLVFNGELNRASKVLFSLAQDEVELVGRKKTILSLSKLASLAADSDLSNLISEINSELLLIDYQEQLPDDLLLSFGYDIENSKVLKPEEIINLFISDENESSNEFDFRKALELLNHVDEPFEVRQKIWCSAILKDSWTNYNMKNPLDIMQNMVFFKLIDICYLMDGDVEEFLPPMEDFLNSSELGDLINNKSFLYLLKLGYEHISESYYKKNL